METRDWDRMKSYRDPLHDQAARMIPWETGIAAANPQCDLCTWTYSHQGKIFRLKYVNRHCREHS